MNGGERSEERPRPERYKIKIILGIGNDTNRPKNVDFRADYRAKEGLFFYNLEGIEGSKGILYEGKG